MQGSPIEKILILAANPLNTARLRLDKEVEEIRTTLRLANNRDCFAIESRGAVRPEDLQQHLYDLKPQIVHFSGHGDGEQGLAIEDENGNLRLVSTAALADLFKLFANDVECVLLNACYSEVQAEAIHQYVPYVIGMNQAIGDMAARKFAEGFYRAIWDGRPIEEAFASGVNAIDLRGIPEHLTPVLKQRKNLGSSSLPFDPIVEEIPPIKPVSKDLLEEPEGLVGLNSAFYVERPPIEERCFKAIAKKGALIRVKAPRQMGKSSLMIRILDHATKQGCKTVTLNFQRANNILFADLDKFLRWFCASIGQHLGLPKKFDEYWDDESFTSKDNCTHYFQSYLLEVTASPIALALDEVDLIFQHPAIAADFFGLLRLWHEEAKSVTIWENLRLLVVHSQEVYIPLDINQSPFNVGVPIELTEFDRTQVKELAERHGLAWSNAEIEQLMAMVGGHPYLVRVALYYTARQDISLSQLLQDAPTEAGYYSDHLVRHLGTLEHNAQLTAAMRKVAMATNPVSLLSREAFKLDSMGLVKREGNLVVPRCNLYRLYFRDRLGVSP